MNSCPVISPIRTRTLMRAGAAVVCVLALLGVVLLGASEAGAQSSMPGGLSSQQVTAPSGGGVEATLEECVTAVAQPERAATFSGEMTAVPGTARMAMRIDVEERIPGEVEFHTVTAPGLGVWRSSDAKVKVYKYLKQVSNLSSPASYRGFVRFRWYSAKGHVLKRTARLTAKCLQPESPDEPVEASPASSPAMPSTASSTIPAS